MPAVHELLLLGLAFTPAQNSKPRDDVASGPRVVLESATGERKAQALATLDTQDPRTIGGHRLRFEGLGGPPRAEAGEQRAEIQLSDGDRLRGRVRGGREEWIQVELAGGVRVEVIIDEISSIVWPARIEGLWTETPKAPAEGDRLYRKARDVLDTIEGGVEAFTSEGVQFHGTVLGSKQIPWGEVAALFIEHLPHKDDGGPANPGVRVVVDGFDETRLSGELVRLTGEACVIRRKYSGEISIPLATISGLLVDDGTIAYLSSLAPSDVGQSSPFGDDLGIQWPARFDRSVTNTPLVVGGRTYARGVGVHAPSKLSWKLDGGFRTLRGLVGIDDQVLRLPARGSVIFRVHLDGKPAWESPVVRGGDAALALPPIDVSNARELVLEADVGPDAFVADRANWLDVVLAR